MTWRGLSSAERARKWVVLAIAMGVALLGGLSSAANAATPASSYKLGGLFGPGGGSSNGVSDIAQSPATGNIFFAEWNQTRVGVYSADAAAGGVPLTDFDALSPSGIDAQDIAVDPANDAVYIADTIIGLGVGRFLSDGAPTPTYTFDSSFTPSGFAAPGGMAVDPVSHDLYVADRGANRVVRLAVANGAEVASLDGSNTTGGAFTGVRTVAVGPTGTVYVVDTGSGRVERFSGAGASLGALALPAGASPSAITTNANTGAVAIVAGIGNQTYILGFSAAGARTFTTRVTGAVNAPATGLAWNGVANRIYASRSDGTAFFYDPAVAPGVDAPAVTAGRNTAHASAQVAPGGEDTTARFEYCPSTAACANYPISDPNDPNNPWKRGPDHPNLTTTTTIEDDLPLGSNATWLVRVSADNTVSGTDNVSAITTVNSPLLTPSVTTGTASSVTDSQAELLGTIDTLGASTTYHFEYGLTSSYGSRIPVSVEAAAGSSRTPRVVSRIISGLQSGTTYHFRLVATNSVGTSFGADRTFTTAGPDEVAPNRAYEQVTPVDKRGAAVVTDFHFQTSDDGSAIAVATLAAPRDAVGSLIRQNFLVRRGDSDWLDWKQTDAPQNAAAGLLESSTTAISADFNHALVASNRNLALGGVNGNGNLYVKDLRTGAYTFVATSGDTDAYQKLVSIQANEQVFVAGAPDFSWVMFIGPTSFAPGATAPAIYRWTRATGQVTIESRLPGEVIPPFAVQSPGAKLVLPSVSSDGKVLAFGAASGVYRRVNGQTTAVSESQVTGDPPGEQPGTFDGMSTDGRYVVFHAHARLTNDAPAVGPTDPDNLYRYDAQTGEQLYIDQLNPTSVSVVGISDDGRTIYYDTGSATAVWRNGQKRIATTDRPSTTANQVTVSGSGRYFAWMNDRPPFGDSTAHVYDADKDQAVCVSCGADGSLGVGRLFAGGRTLGNRNPRAITENGYVFFDTPKRLVTADHNGSNDVYAFRNGRYTLISPGDGVHDALFVDASADGSSVFFQTDEGLVSRDVDGETDVYVARIGGGFPSQNPPPSRAPCVRAECADVVAGPAGSPAMPSSNTGSVNGTAKRTNQEKVRISLSRVSFGAKTVKITFQANQRGRVRVSGSRVTTTIRNVAKSGTYSVSVPLSKKARALRRAHKKFKVSLRVSLSGGWGSTSAKYSRTLGK